eukprot:Clim_evm6s153 gene=Clim_evmTU6s153
MAKVRIHANWISQPSRSVLWLCLIGNVDHQFIKVDLFKGETHTPEYRAINPKGNIPYMEDGEVKLQEAAGIMAYLCDTRGLDDWYPKDPSTRARVDEYLHWHHNNTRKASIGIMRPKVWAKLGAPAGNKDANKDIEKVFWKSTEHLEGIFKENNWLAKTAQPTIADLFAYCEYDQLEAFGFWPSDQYPSVTEWMKRMEKLPFYTETHEGLFNLASTVKERLQDS